MKIEYHLSLGAELEDTRNYYDEQSPGLVRDFVDEFERQVLAIASMPERWMIVERDIRRVLMKRFPYVVYFRILDDDTIRITVVKHEKRHSAYGRQRT